MGFLLNAVFVCSLFAALSQAHICTMFPNQRGGANISSWANDACFKRTPCELEPAQGPFQTVKEGQHLIVRLQQNANHFNPIIVGHIDVAISFTPSDSSSWTTLASELDYPAHDQVAQLNYSLPVVIPSGSSGAAVLRVRYVSNNPDEIDPKDNTQAIFWQCSDLKVEKSPVSVVSARQVHVARKLRTIESSKAGCCAPAQFQMTGKQMSSSGADQDMAMYVDQTKKLTRWDKDGVQLYNNYTALKEWIYHPVSDTCRLVGPDQFYGFCFGSHLGRGTYQRTNGTSNGVQHWTADNGFKWGSTVDSCYPSYFDGKTKTIQWTNQKPLESHSVLDLPLACLKVTEMTSLCGRPRPSTK